MDLLKSRYQFFIRGSAGQVAKVRVPVTMNVSIWAGTVIWLETWFIPLVTHVLLNVTAAGEVMWVTGIVSVVVLMDGVMLINPEDVGN